MFQRELRHSNENNEIDESMIEENSCDGYQAENISFDCNECENVFSVGTSYQVYKSADAGHEDPHQHEGKLWKLMYQHFHGWMI